MSTSDRYRRFGSVEARGQSACYEAWAEGVADDPELVGLIDGLPEAQRQPNLVFAAARFVGIGAGAVRCFPRPARRAVAAGPCCRTGTADPDE